MFRHHEIGDFRAEALSEGDNDVLRLSVELKKGTEPDAASRRLINEMKEKFELAPEIVVLETGTLAREFEANIKAARFVDRRG
jgi:phenylacetate-CoA ligase